VRILALTDGRDKRPKRFGARDTGKAQREVTSMEKTRYEVVPMDGGWAVETGGKSTPAFPSKELAISAATARAKEDSPADVIVHAEDGSVEEELTV
jgi:Uncharacterized protein conserved in bacteria (DUF2188)